MIDEKRERLDGDGDPSTSEITDRQYIELLGQELDHEARALAGERAGVQPEATGMSDEGITTCPECGEPMYADEEWIITDRSLIGTEIGEGGIGGDYAHERCMGRS